MASIAASDERGAGGRARVLEGVKWALSAPVIVALVTAALTATVVPLLTREWQNHERRLNLKTAIAIDMSRSTANAIGAGRRVGTGVVYALTADPRVNRAVIQDAYNRGFGQWQVDQGRLAAQLVARFPDDPIVDDWRGYATSVEQFYRLGAVIDQSDRRRLVRLVRDYLSSELTLEEATWGARWKALRDLPRAKARKSATYFERKHRFRRAYIDLSEKLLFLGSEFVERVLTLSPKV
jgi:hypothetical protein